MAGYTSNFHYAFFDFGDRLNSPINIQREIDRFVLIDKQMYCLYSIFGDGVVSGWEILEQKYTYSDGISVAITSGNGVIRSRPAETTTTKLVSNMPSNSILYIYAKLNNIEFPTANDISFIFSEYDNMTSMVKIGKVTTSDTGVTEIDNTYKDFIIVTNQIEDAVANHRHRGSPPKIDLSDETKNTLSGAKIGPLGSEKITSGSFDLERVPTLDHNDLLNIGVLSHADIDTYLSNFSLSNLGLLGEVSTANRAKQTIYIKHLYSDVDEFFVNEINFIPGISPDSDYDSVNTTAIVDKTAHTIAGLPLGGATAYFFTKEFSLPTTISNCFITSESEGNGTITYGINTDNSVDFDNDYEEITINSVNSVSGTGSSMRIGIKLVSPDDLFTHPSTTDFSDYIDFEFENASGMTKSFDFRIKFYTDVGMTNLFLTKFSSTDQTGWLVDDSTAFPAGGLSLDAGEITNITYYPSPSLFASNTTYYFEIDIWDGSSFSAGGSGFTFLSHGLSSEEKYQGVPRVNNFTVLIELSNNQKVILS